MEWSAIGKAVVALFAIVNPIGSIPIFLQFTQRMQPAERARAFRTGVLSATAILLVFLFAGEPILKNFFQIEVSDLMAAGGLLLLIIAMDHLVFGTLVRNVTSGDPQEAHHIGAVPIACPVLAGPGAMMAVLLIYSEDGWMVAAVAVAIVMLATWLILRFIDTVYAVLGKTVCTVLSKILCLFIAAIGMRLLMQGISGYFQP